MAADEPEFVVAAELAMDDAAASASPPLRAVDVAAGLRNTVRLSRTGLVTVSHRLRMYIQLSAVCPVLQDVPNIQAAAECRGLPEALAVAVLVATGAGGDGGGGEGIWTYAYLSGPAVDLCLASARREKAEWH